MLDAPIDDSISLKPPALSTIEVSLTFHILRGKLKGSISNIDKARGCVVVVDGYLDALLLIQQSHEKNRDLKSYSIVRKKEEFLAKYPDVSVTFIMHAVRMVFASSMLI